MSTKPKLPAMSSAGSPNTGVGGMNSMHNDIGEKSGFQTSGYIDKKGTPYGDGVSFNKMPPGMDISEQDVADIRSMQLKTLTDTSYPGDGWAQGSRDIPE